MNRYSALIAVVVGVEILSGGVAENTALAKGPGSTVLDEPVVKIPMDLSTSHVAVEVFINGEGPFPFNLDTYAVTTACVDHRFAEKMKLRKVGDAWNSDGSGERHLRDVVLIPEVRFGGATFTNVRALVDDYSWVETPAGGSVDGLLGYHLFSDLLLELDYPNQLVVLREGDLPKTPHVITDPLLHTSPDCNISIGGEQLKVGIDSGAHSGLALPASFIDRLKLEEPPVVVGHAKTVYSEADVSVGVLAEPVSVAGHEHTGMAVTFSELFGRPLLGHDFLVQYAVTFDQKNGRVQFLRPEAVDQD